MAIHVIKNDPHSGGSDSYQISSRRAWLDGVYDSERAAKYAFRFSDAELHKLSEKINQGERLITFADLQVLHKEIKARNYGCSN